MSKFSGDDRSSSIIKHYSSPGLDLPEPQSEYSISDSILSACNTDSYALGVGGLMDRTLGSPTSDCRRNQSPTPSHSSASGISLCPSLSRSFSTNSSSECASSLASSCISTTSSASSTSASLIVPSSSKPFQSPKSCSGESAPRASRVRGYVRPQGAIFAPSASNRESVQSLGSIAHLQHYFARTGLLDGKGAQLAQDDRGKPGHAYSSGDISLDNHDLGERPMAPAPALYDSSAHFTDNDTHLNDHFQENSVYQNGHRVEPIMLPPTVSTYCQRTPKIEPLPDLQALRNDLRDALRDAKQVLSNLEILENPERGFEIDNHRWSLEKPPNEVESPIARLTSNQDPDLPLYRKESSPWHRIQGMRILDVITLAIKAAKTYFTAHPAPQRLYGLKSERRLRQDLLTVMDALKRMVLRDFSPDTMFAEAGVFGSWLSEISKLLAEECALQNREEEIQRRTRGKWIDDESWSDSKDERAREYCFLNAFMPIGESLPFWTNPSGRSLSPSSPNSSSPLHASTKHMRDSFLSHMRTGICLILIHNACVRQSCRPFGLITVYHSDTSKPYRCAENLRYWLKAAELRWDVKLEIDVSGVVHGDVEHAFEKFEAALLRWSQAVRTELMKDFASKQDLSGCERSERGSKDS